MFKPARRFASALGIAAMLLTGTTVPTAAQAQTYLRVPTSEPKYAAIVVDANTGEVLYSKRADSPRYPASITKVMTLYLTFEALAEGRLRLNDRIVMSPRAAAQSPTKIGLRPGQTIRVEDAIQALTVKSANDIAVALAEHLGGTESKFAALMTLRANELGMTSTRFVNASGLPDTRQVSTARDLAVLSRSIMRDYPQYYSYFGVKQFTYNGVTMNNHNRLLRQMPGVDGLKTGFTNASGFNLAASAVRDGRRLIAVVLGGSSGAARDDNVEDLLLTGFDVIRRRAHGEHITIAQNLFEPEPRSGAVRPSIEQGDTEQPGMQVVLTNNPAAASKPKVSKTVAALKKGDWTVQVGAFKSKKDASAHLAQMDKKYGRLLDGEGTVASRLNGYYRVQFTGMAEGDAKAACKSLKAKKQPCLVMAP